MPHRSFHAAHLAHLRLAPVASNQRPAVKPRSFSRPYNVGMSRSSVNFRRMAVLALIAVLLAAVAPTVSRVLAAAAPGDAPVLMEMCTAAGVKMAEISPHLGDGDEPAQPMSQMMGDACGYCVLVTSLPLALLLLCMLAPRPPATSAFRLYAALLQYCRNTRGLGSQAPPSRSEPQPC